MFFKISIFYSYSVLYSKKLKCLYLKAEIKHIRRSRPLDPNISQDIVELKERTMFLIQENNNDYNKNTAAMLNMLNISLFKNKNKIQEYYTEHISERTDFITSLLEIINHMIRYNKIIEASYNLVLLLKKLKYHRVVIIVDTLLPNIINSLILKGKTISNEVDAKEHYRNLWEIIYCHMYSVYLYNYGLDLSYCRLGKIDENIHQHIYYFTYNHYLESLYTSITENNFLTTIEKNRLFDELYIRIKLMKTEEIFSNNDVRYIKKKFTPHSHYPEIPTIIKGEPLVLMFIKMFENKDVKTIKHFQTMNAPGLLEEYVITLTTLSLLEFMHNNCVRQYVTDLELNKNDIITTIKETSLTKKRKYSHIKELADLYHEHYTKDNSVNRPYMLHSRLRLSPEVIDTYLYYIYTTNKIIPDSDTDFCSLIEKKEFTPNSNIIKLIEEMNAL